MALFTRKPVQLPPTNSSGYQPPLGAKASNWVCSNDACLDAGHDPDNRRWPKACPQCGAPVRTGRLEEPWAHAEQRHYIDSRLAAPSFEGQGVEDDIIWHYEDAARREDRPAADAARARLHAYLDTDGKSEGLSGEPRGLFSTRLAYVSLVLSATNNGRLDDAAEELGRWFSISPLEWDEGSLKENLVNLRQLGDSLVRFLEAPGAATHPARGRLLEILLKVVHTIGSDSPHLSGKYGRLSGEPY